MNPTIAIVRSNALYWWSYKSWAYGDKNIRGFEMKKAMAEIVLYGALYGAQQRLKLGVSR